MIDGCPLVCAQKCLERHGITPDEHVQLAECGVKKRFHADFDVTEAERIIDQVTESVAELGTTDANRGGARPDREGVAVAASLRSPG